MSRTVHPHLLLAALVAAVLAATAGCSEDDAPETTITVREADARIESHLRAIAAAIPAQDLQSLDPRRDPGGRPLAEPLVAPCGGVLGGAEDGRVTVSRAYALDDIPTSQVDAAIQTAVDYMTAHDYTITTMALDQGLVRAAAPDGTTALVIQRTVDGYVTIGADSSCVWPDGTRPAR